MDARREAPLAVLPPNIVRLSPEEVKQIERQGGVFTPSKTTGEHDD
jgi:hypothetical protein